MKTICGILRNDVWSRSSFKLALVILASAMALVTSARAQEIVVPLWSETSAPSSDQAPRELIRVTPEGDHVVSRVTSPSITAFLPAKDQATGLAVLVIPGGGHSEIWIDHEGYAVADEFKRHGIAAFVLKYRLARESGSTYTVEGTELQDTQRAIRLIRSRASEWGLDPNRVGVLGFSAGGELAELAASRYDTGSAGASDAIERQSSKPAFQALIYPAIPADPRLSKDSPPAFLACGANDRQDISEGMAKLYLSMKQTGISVELHIFSNVGHGFGIRATSPGNVADWPTIFRNWLESSGFLKPSQAPK